LNVWDSRFEAEDESALLYCETATVEWGRKSGISSLRITGKLEITFSAMFFVPSFSGLLTQMHSI
jgi:hypothetical protein